MQITHIPLDRLRGHPLNSNVMAGAMFEKLVRHIERTGNYPPLVVRLFKETASPGDEARGGTVSAGEERAEVDRAGGREMPHGRLFRPRAEALTVPPRVACVYEILDGHHRCAALRRLGHLSAACVVWDVDDQGAMMLLTTLNRLHGDDDPRKRGELVGKLSEAAGGWAELKKLLPDGEERLERLMGLRRELPEVSKPRELEQMPVSVHFFLTGEQRRRLDERLAEIGGRREEALMRLVGEGDNDEERNSNDESSSNDRSSKTPHCFVI